MPAHPCTIVVATDEALRLSLVFLLEVCGIPAVAYAGVDELIANRSLDAQFIFIDCSLSESSGTAEINELRKLGWRGTAVFMAETEGGLDRDLPDGPSHVLVKPFTPEDVVAIVGR